MLHDILIVVVSAFVAVVAVEAISAWRSPMSDSPPPTRPDVPTADQLASPAWPEAEMRPQLAISRIPSDFVRGRGKCDVCGVELPPGALRTHDGHWRCAEHKTA